jgi:hypothetical protein
MGGRPGPRGIVPLVEPVSLLGGHLKGCPIKRDYRGISSSLNMLSHDVIYIAMQTALL